MKSYNFLLPFLPLFLSLNLLTVIRTILLIIAWYGFSPRMRRSWGKIWLLLFEVEISLRAPFHSFKCQGSDHSDSVRWDNCGRALPLDLRVSSFPWWVSTLCLDGIISSHWLRWVNPAGVFIIIVIIMEVVFSSLPEDFGRTLDHWIPTCTFFF